VKDPSLLVRFLRGFAIFWWDFLVGDTPELFVAIIAVLGVVSLLSVVAQFNVLAYIALPFLAAMTLGVSLYRTLRKR
jgi:hypothetical protein